MVSFNKPDSSRRIGEGPLHSVLEGKCNYVVSFAGRSQYTGEEGGRAGAGASACGLAALNCARIILKKERNGSKGFALLGEMMRKETLEVSVIDVCLPVVVFTCATI